jgi:hypothetical protein
MWISTLHSSSAGSLTTAHNAWIQCVTDMFNNVLKTTWTPATEITDLETVSLDPATGHQVSKVSSGVNLQGTEALGQALPPRDCQVISKKTTTPTKAGRGRMFLPGPSTTHLATDGLLLGAHATSLASTIAQAWSQMATITQPVIYHHATRSATNIIGVAVGQVLGTQSRRTNRVFNAYSVSPL